MSSFTPTWDRAVTRHGEEALRSRFPVVRTVAELRALPDHRALAAIAERVFAAGFRWKVIRAKWEGFEEAFHGFDPAWVAALDAEGIAALCADARIVRNRPKVLCTVANARFVQEVAAAHGSFGRWVADWPDDDVVGLWAALKEGGDRLGGDTGPWVLRMLGKDSFRLTSDVVAALQEAGVVDKAPTSRKALAAVQEAMNGWRRETGLSLGALSVVLASSTGVVYGEED
ncbi:MAG: DNA-3-methyladenine glycosylase I [Alphaproteobacteria bacterium]|nr:DNA-3-methyladenine glycosylase I [Alphaproteobacteria bacterium]